MKTTKARRWVFSSERDPETVGLDVGPGETAGVELVVDLDGQLSRVIEVGGEIGAIDREIKDNVVVALLKECAATIEQAGMRVRLHRVSRGDALADVAILIPEVKHVRETDHRGSRSDESAMGHHCFDIKTSVRCWNDVNGRIVVEDALGCPARDV